MRKILLGTTAVAGAALMSIGAAQAQQAPTVRVGGYFEFSGAYIDDSADKNAVTVGTGTTARTEDRDKIDFRSDAEIHILVSAKAANGLSYGANIELQVDNITTGGSGTGLDTDEMWGFVSSPTLGTLQFGDQDHAADQMKVTIPGVTALGMSVIWDDFVMPGPDGNRYLLADINDGNDASKIIYLSPQFFGFDFGVSFAANRREGESHNSPSSTAVAQRDPTDGNRNELSGAIRYRGSFGNVGVAASFGAIRADAQESAASLQDPTQYQAGLNLTAFGATIGGFYSWGKFGGITMAAIPSGRGNSTNYGLGASYTLAGVQLGAFYAKAERDNGPGVSDRRETMWGLGAVYGLAPGLEVFANYTNVEDENYAPVGGVTPDDRDIDIFIIGTRLAF
jgi:predicted porin